MICVECGTEHGGVRPGGAVCKDRLILKLRKRIETLTQALVVPCRYEFPAGNCVSSASHSVSWSDRTAEVCSAHLARVCVDAALDSVSDRECPPRLDRGFAQPYVLGYPAATQPTEDVWQQVGIETRLWLLRLDPKWETQRVTNAKEADIYALVKTINALLEVP